MEAILKTSQLQLDEKCNPWCTPRPKLIKAMAEEMKVRGRHEGKPIFVMYDGKDYWLYGGHFVYWAALEAGLTQLPAIITMGTLLDAQWKCLDVPTYN